MSTDQPAADPNWIDWPYTHPFRRPAEILGDRENSVTLREPTAGDLLKHGVLDGMLSGESMIGLIAELSGWLPPKVKLIPGSDMISLSGKLSRFFAAAAA